MKQAIRFFSANPRKIKNSRQAIGFILSGSTILVAFLLHLFWFSYFWKQDLTRLVVANGAGIAVCLLLFLWNRSGTFLAATSALSVEMLLYAAYAAIVLGWDAGCQWYILVFTLPHFLYLSTTKPVRRWIALVGLALLMFSYFLTHAMAAPFGDRDFVVLRFTNTLLVFALPLLQAALLALTPSPSQLHFRQRSRSERHAASIDPLTKLWGRSYGEGYFPMLSSSSGNYSAVLLRIDHFRQINARYGQAIGDQILFAFSKLLKKRFRVSDVIIRWGGDEFLLILHRTDLMSAYRIVDDFRQYIAQQPVDVKGALVSYTVTAGVSEHEKGCEKSVEQILEECGECLAHGKNSGGNQVVYPSLR